MTFSGRRARELGQEVVFVTERCVIRLLPEGLTVTEIAPGISVARDIVGQTSLDLRISPDLRQMDARLFQPGSHRPAPRGARRMTGTIVAGLRMQVDGPIATITLDRPEKLNAVTPEMLEGLEAALTSIEADDAVRVVVLTGAGDRAFCAGADIDAWSSLAPHRHVAQVGAARATGSSTGSRGSASRRSPP